MAQPWVFLPGTFCQELASEPGAPALLPIPASPRPRLAGDVLSKVFPHPYILLEKEIEQCSYSLLLLAAGRRKDLGSSPSRTLEDPESIS